ncbi:disks large homolog 5-like [Babylonia areolata]|uniref:disks large homolog 5-like n=1 Tax=Babylonia areolata TaxID=304850 RepID=UPI003FCF5DE4
MEELKKRIGFLRAKFNKQGLDVDKLLFILKRDQLIPPEHVTKIEKQTTSSAKLDMLLDEIVSANESIYHKLMTAVEQCVPQVAVPSAYPASTSPVPPQFVNQTLKNRNHRSDVPGSESYSTSLTSDSEDDILRSCTPGLTDVHGKELPTGYGKLSNILNTRSYDHSASSSFLVLNERYSPLTLSDERPADRHLPLEAIRKQISSDNRFDWVNFKMQCDGALGELETLKQQNAEKIGQLSQKAECFRNLYKKSEAVNQQTQKELHTVKTLNVELLATKQQLQESLEQLKKLREDDELEINELRLQLNKAIGAMSGPGPDTADMLTDMYHASLQKYDALRKDYDVVRERYADLAAKHASACCQLEAMDDLHKQMEEMRRERDTTMRDKMAFQQQCTSVIQNLDQTMNEHRRLKAEYYELQREHEDCGKSQRQLMSRLSQMQKECSMALAAKIDAETEHQQILKERVVVHQELQELNDAVSEKSKESEKHNREKLAAEKEVERLKQELAAAVAVRDKYRQESQGAHEVRSQLEVKLRETQREIQVMERQRDAARKERHQALEQIQQTYEKSQKEKAEEMDQVAKEAEVLKKQIDKIKHELTDAEQEATKATERRDWAFSEIDKTVQERESIRILCDNLRRDRDRAVSELAKALRNSDECEKQKNDAVKELKEIRDKYEAMVERDTRRQQLNSVGHNHSRDSAIDADLQEWETETLEIELDGGEDHDLGFDLVGGKDSPQFPGDTALYISHVAKGGAAEGKLRVNDMLLKVNNLDTTNTERHRAQKALSNHSRAVTLVVRRRKMSATRTWQPLQLLISCQKEGSIQLEQGLFVSAVHSGRIIGKDGLLPSFGDQIISINHQSTENLTVQEALDLLEKSSQPVAVGILRQSSPLSSTGSSPTPTSVSVLSPLTEQLSPTQSAVMSKSDTLAAHTSLWGDSTSGDSARSGGDSSKNLRSSGSQTDSLDSPGPSPPKSLRNHDHDKVRHSMPVLDKAKEIVVETLFRSRNKSQDRERNSDKQYSKDDMVEHRSSKDKARRRDVAEEMKRPVSVMVPSVAHGVDDVLVEFPSPIFSRASPNTDNKSRKREYEADSNNGTWPKSRSGVLISGNVPSTVTLASAKERPSIQDPLIFQPPSQQRKNSVEGGGGFALEHGGVRHSPQNSTTSSVKYPASTGVVQPFLPSPKSPPHFSVGVMQSAVRPAFPRQWPGHTPPSHHHHSHTPRAAPIHSYPHPHPCQQPPPHAKPGLSSHPLPLHSGPKPLHADLYPATLHPQRVTPKVGGRSHRPASAPHRGHNADRQWPPPPPPHPSWPQPAASPSLSRHYPPKAHFPDAAITTHRPTSLEVPTSSQFRFGEEGRVASPVELSVGSGMPGWLPQSPSHTRAAVSSSSSQHSSRPLMMNPRHSSPPGTFSAISPELEVEHTLFPSPSVPCSPPAPHHHSSPSPSQQSFTGLDRITPTPSEEFNARYIRPPPHGSHHQPLSEVELRQPGGGGYYPRHDKHLERIRIPSSNSVTTKSGSVEIVSDRSSPVSSIMPIDRSGSSKEHQHSLTSNRDDYLYGPRHHETRTITFESSEPVGFQIQGGPAGGIFVSAVNDNSLASQAGLVIGDQLLEVCGINMRNATHEHAVTVLRQCRDNIRMKVQFNPEKYMDSEETPGPVSPLSSPVTNSPTHSKLTSGDSEQSTPKHHPPQRSKSCSSGDGTYERSHVVPIKRHKGDTGPGFSIVGGNAVGIFIHDIDPSSPAAAVLQRGYKILEYNNVSFQALTLEQAFLELNKPCSTMRLNVHNCLSKYNKVQNIPGDHFFIRTNFSRAVEGEGELDFEKDAVLMVESTMHRGALGVWLAWLLDPHGNKLRCGTIPSRLRLGDEMVLKRSHSESWSLGESDELKGSRRGGSGSARRSFFRRRHHQRTSSKDSREGSFSEVSLTSESVPILDESALGYTQVERIESDQTRPVVLLAPLADALIKKLVSESPDKYKFCEPCTVRALMKDMEQSLAEGRLVDYWKKDDLFECIQVTHIRSISDEKIHGLLDVNPRAIERLHRLKIYPIVIFVHHKSAKQLREIRDSQFLPEKLSSKASKDSYDNFAKVEVDCSHLFSAVVQGGNLAEMSTHIKATINAEQKKAIWVSVSCL